MEFLKHRHSLQDNQSLFCVFGGVAGGFLPTSTFQNFLSDAAASYICDTLTKTSDKMPIAFEKCYI